VNVRIFEIVAGVLIGYEVRLIGRCYLKSGRRVFEFLVGAVGEDRPWRGLIEARGYVQLGVEREFADVFVTVLLWLLLGLGHEA